MRFTTIPLALVLLLFAMTSFAQTARRKTPSRPVSSSRAIPKPSSPPVAEPKATPVSTKAPLPPKALVTVNGQTLTTADFDPALRQQLDSLEDKIREARQKVLELQINTTLLEVEAKKRHTTSQQLYDLEVTKKIVEPTAAEIKNFSRKTATSLRG